MIFFFFVMGTLNFYGLFIYFVCNKKPNMKKMWMKGTYVLLEEKWEEEQKVLY